MISNEDRNWSTLPPEILSHILSYNPNAFCAIRKTCSNFVHIVNAPHTRNVILATLNERQFQDLTRLPMTDELSPVTLLAWLVHFQCNFRLFNKMQLNEPQALCFIALLENLRQKCTQNSTLIDRYSRQFEFFERHLCQYVESNKAPFKSKTIGKFFSRLLNSNLENVLLAFLKRKEQIYYVASLAHEALSKEKYEFLEKCLVLEGGKRLYCGSTLLNSAVVKQDETAVRLLLKHGADPNQQDIANGNTALHEASQSHNANMAIISLLLEAGGNPTIKNNWHQLPHYGFEKQGKLEELKSLRFPTNLTVYLRRIRVAFALWNWLPYYIHAKEFVSQHSFWGRNPSDPGKAGLLIFDKGEKWINKSIETIDASCGRFLSVNTMKELVEAFPNARTLIVISCKYPLYFSQESLQEMCEKINPKLKLIF